MEVFSRPLTLKRIDVALPTACDLKTKLSTVDIKKAGETWSLDEKAKILANRMKDQLDTNDRNWPKTGKDRDYDPFREQDEYYYNLVPKRGYNDGW